MNAPDIETLKKTLNKKLPEWYSSFLTNYPEYLIELGAPSNTVSYFSLPNTLERLIEINDDFGDIPEFILIIGVDGCGNFYYIILGDENSKIYLHDHEIPVEDSTIDIRESWKKGEFCGNNIEEFIEFLKEIMDESDDFWMEEN